MAVEISVKRTAKNHPTINSLTERIRTKAASHFRALGLTDPELSVVLTDDNEIQELNRRWRGVDAPTDVLSFPQWEPDAVPDWPGVPLGDIVISVSYAERTCADARHKNRVAQNLDVDVADLDWTLVDEVDFLMLHGLLHLMGHDHAEPGEEARMRAEEARLWHGSVKDETQ
jgi:probable rRNA maturation factor